MELKAKYKAAVGKDWKPDAHQTSSNPPSKAKSASPPKEVSSGPGDQLNNEITAAGNKVRDLKSKKAEKAEIDSAVAALLDLKAKYKAATGQDWKPPGGAGGGESKKNESKKGGDGGGKKKKEQPKKEPKKEAASAASGQKVTR